MNGGRLVLKKIVAAVLMTFLVTAFTTTAVVTQDEWGSDDSDVTTEVIQSKILPEEREIVIHLPDSYQEDAGRRYPVLYVLDGLSQSRHTAETARLLARLGLMPQIIVIAIPNTSGENRQRDYTPPYIRADAKEKSRRRGEANRFLRFLELELIPHVERSYRTTPTRMLAGNSRGGLFVVYSLIERPTLFAARFAYSPALHRDDDRILKELRVLAKASSGDPTFLYLSVGDGENENIMRAFRKTAALIRTWPPAALRWRADITAGAHHGNNAILSTPVALHEYYRVARQGGNRLQASVVGSAATGTGQASK